MGLLMEFHLWREGVRAMPGGSVGLVFLEGGGAAGGNRGVGCSGVDGNLFLA